MVDDATKSVAVKPVPSVERWRIEIVSGPSKGLVRRFEQGVIRVGSARSNDVVLSDGKVSRHHLLIEVRPGGLRARDLGSKNGTFYRGSKIDTAELPVSGAVLTLGETEMALAPDEAPTPGLAPSMSEKCGRLLGQSEAMRLVFAQIERIAPTSATVLVHGETGTGKELVAEAIHGLSERAHLPLVVVDCSSIPADLIESELFGHVRGAFTGATQDREGAFELARGGTVFLDEIGELALDLQPRLLRVLETGQVKRVGASRSVTCDVRVVAASLRDLPAGVRAGTFRDDLYYRLSVVRIDVPPLRLHLDDLPLLVDHFLRELGAPPLGPDTMRTLTSYAWPGNVRQLRNVLERAAALAGGGPVSIHASDLEQPSPPSLPPATLSLPYKVAKDEMVARFTKEYLEALLARNGGNVSAAAREAQVDRNWIVALARRYGVRARD